MNFAEIDDKYAQLETSQIVMIPVPYDGTSTFMKGADKGPQALIEASVSLEWYDIETGTEVYKEGIHITEPVTESTSPEAMVEAVFAETKKYLETGKFVTVVGGEHSVSIGTIRAFAEKYDNLTVLHLDAHSDLRQEYEGSACNHACAMAKAQNTTNLIQVGIRSMDIGELEYMNKENVFFAHEIQTNPHWMEQAIEKMTDNVFITIDLDVFDPSVIPSTGTPQPGGLLWYEVMSFFKKVSGQKNIVGFDIMELCPNEHAKASDVAAAKLYYKLLSYKFAK